MTPWEIAAAVADPELPTMTLEDLGILRSAEVEPSGAVRVVLTPTYSGCPAMEAIRQDVTAALHRAGYARVTIQFDLAPAWSTDCLGPKARRHLEEAGIAPPSPAGKGAPLQLTIKCPRCGSLRTEELSRFGSTACKSLWRCTECREPFEHFKAHR